MLVLVEGRFRWSSVKQQHLTPTRTSTRPPHPLHPTPCPYRTGANVVCCILLHRDAPLRQPEPGAVVARANGDVRAVDMHGERDQHVGIVGVVFQAQAVRA